MKMAVVASYSAVPFMLTVVPSGRKKLTVGSSQPMSLAACAQRPKAQGQNQFISCGIKQVFM